MSSEESSLRDQIVDIIIDVNTKLESARKIATTEYVNPQPLTRDELLALKQSLLDAYTTSATAMGVIKRLNAASNAHNSSLKTAA